MQKSKSCTSEKAVLGVAFLQLLESPQSSDSSHKTIKQVLAHLLQMEKHYRHHVAHAKDGSYRAFSVDDNGA